MAEFRMPSLGADMDSGTVVEWLVRPGDTVRRGDAVAVVDTAKAAVEVECFDSGVVGAILVPEGTSVPVGTPLATIESETSRAAPATPPVSGPATPAPRAEVPASQRAEPSAAPRPATTGPLVRKLAAELGVDLARVRGTGRGEVITRADVRRAAQPEPAPQRRPKATPYARRLARDLGVDLAAVPFDGGVIRAADIRGQAPRPTPAADRGAAARLATARLMERSKREIPHYYLSTTIDLTATLDHLAGLNRDLPVDRRVLPVAPLLRACALAAVKVPALNGFWADDRFTPGQAVNLGVAVSLRSGGLITPAVADADRLGVVELMDRVRDVVTRARSGRLRGSELTGATITATSLGDRGVESVFGVIYPPQVALVGIGKVVDRPWAVDGLLGVRPVVTVTLAADHRANDGHTGALFLEAVEKALSTPEGA